MLETNTPCVPFDMFLFYHFERCQKVHHVRHHRLKECRQEGTGTRPDYLVNRVQKIEGPSGEKNCSEIEK